MLKSFSIILCFLTAVGLSAQSKTDVSNFKVVNNDNVTSIMWTVKNETDRYVCFLEKSIDGKSFVPIKSKTGKSSSYDVNYTININQSSSEMVYYRIKKQVVGRSYGGSSITYSNVLKVNNIGDNLALDPNN